VSDYGKAVREILSDNGCEFVRHGKGDHDIWQSPISGKRFPVDHTIKSRHTANGILKQAGLEKQF
jgi:predicted RNA binding protein YcfA (HicA-like mRNA interferase family)